MKKTAALLLAFALCFCTFFSCNGNKKENVIEIEGGNGVSINFLYLLTAMNKTMYESAIEQSSGGDWNSVVYSDEGITWADLLMDVVLEDSENFLICEYLYDNVYGLELSKDDLLLIEEGYNDYVAAAGSEKNLENMLSEYSADKETFNRYLELTVKQLNLRNHLYGTEGVERISDDTVKNVFAEDYSIVTHIYFNTVTTTTADGKVISIGEEEAAEKTALAENVFAALSAGEDFYALKEQYSEDTYESEYYPNGFFVTSDSTFPAAFTTAAMEMNEGEYRLVDSGNGLHIMLKLPMDESLYNSDTTVYNTIYSRLVTLEFEALIEANLDKLTISDENMAKIEAINVQNVPGFALLTQ